MKIVHICLGCFFPDGFSYQENMLPKFHKQQGHDVEVIASLLTFDKNGNGALYPEASTYRNEYDIQVTRLDYKKPKKVYRFLRCFEGFREALEKSSPDLIFIHGCQFFDIRVIAQYAKKHSVKIYVDNHADFSNSARNWLSKTVLHGVLWKRCAQIILPYTKKFYGVLPVRVDFLRDVYGIPEQKCELLVMGADDELVAAANSPAIRGKIRKTYNISDDDFLVITGGKIDRWKTQTLLLMEAVHKIPGTVKLIVFGSVTPELRGSVDALCDGEKVQYIGWVKPKDSYSLFAAADLVVFPGRHSVFWEQVVAQGVPMLVKDWPGTHHVDVGGNVQFLYDDSVDEISQKIKRLIEIPEQYEKMYRCAKDHGMMEFSYDNIAHKAIEDGNERKNEKTHMHYHT